MDSGQRMTTTPSRLRRVWSGTIVQACQSAMREASMRPLLLLLVVIVCLPSMATSVAAAKDEDILLKSGTASKAVLAVAGDGNTGECGAQ